MLELTPSVSLTPLVSLIPMEFRGGRTTRTFKILRCHNYRKAGSKMVSRAYSMKKDAAWIFSDLLNYVARRGWFNAGPSADNGRSLLYASFHVHPDDADFVYALIMDGVRDYGGGTAWTLDRQQNNRFVLCPVQVESKAREFGNFGKATEEVRLNLPELEHGAALDLILLSDFLYKSYIESKE